MPPIKKRRDRRTAPRHDQWSGGPTSQPTYQLAGWMVWHQLVLSLLETKTLVVLLIISSNLILSPLFNMTLLILLTFMALFCEDNSEDLLSYALKCRVEYGFY